jgi:anti-sigma regulatory factor (Ser/Thr protein kinase)
MLSINSSDVVNRLVLAMKRNHTSQEVLDFLLKHIEDEPGKISGLASKHFNISRQAINRHLSVLVERGTLSAEGNTKKRSYKLIPTLERRFDFQVSSDLKEDTLWRTNILPFLTDLKPNVLEICNFGFTEIMNNVIDHSESKFGYASLTLYPNRVELRITDFGVGIFKKITNVFHLEDERLAVLELTKGKLTTDQTRHSGEGIFFTSKMFDHFSILSGTIFFTNSQWSEDYILIQNDNDVNGTMITMIINKSSERTMNAVYSRYSTVGNDLSFSRTHVPVTLARFGNEQLVSRSQAKRLLTRLEPFKEVFLDFKGVNTIGQAFADEIFRVYKNQHPDINFVWINTNLQIENMIKRVQSGLPGEDQLQLGI